MDELTAVREILKNKEVELEQSRAHLQRARDQIEDLKQLNRDILVDRDKRIHQTMMATRLASFGLGKSQGIISALHDHFDRLEPGLETILKEASPLRADDVQKILRMFATLMPQRIASEKEMGNEGIADGIGEPHDDLGEKSSSSGSDGGSGGTA